MECGYQLGIAPAARFLLCKDTKQMAKRSSPFQEAAMKLDYLLEQKVDSDDCYHSIKSICCSRNIHNIGPTMFSSQKIYDYGKHFGSYLDRIHITPHINGSNTIKARNSNLVPTEPVYANVRDSDNSGFIHECDIV